MGDNHYDEVSAAEAERLTGQSERTIRRRITAKTLPARRFSGKRYAIRRQEQEDPAGLPDLLARLAELEAHVERTVQQLPQLLTQPNLDGTPDATPDQSSPHGEE